MNISNEEKKNLEEIVQKIWGMPIEEAYKKLPNEMNELCKEEKLAISFYTEKGDKITNPYLRNGKLNIEGITEEQADLYAETLSKSLNKLTDTVGIFYRRMAFENKTYMRNMILRYAEAIAYRRPYTDEAFFSTSIDDNMLIENPTDIGIIVNGKRGRNIEKISQDPNEREVLFDKKTPFRIISIQHGENFSPTYRHIEFIVEMEEVWTGLTFFKN